MPPQPSELVGMLANQLPEPSPLAEEIAKASMFRRLLRKYGGPHVTSMVERIPKTAQAALELFGPQADVLAMKESSSAVARALQDPNLSPIDKLREALIGSAYTAAAIPMMALPGTIAWHGTPHKWASEPGHPHGRPRLDKMGTGEGAQAFGKGHYSGGAKDTAKTYVPRDPDLEAVMYKNYKYAEDAQDYEAMEVWEAAMLHETPNEIRARFNTPEYSPSMREKANKIADELQNIRQTDPYLRDSKPTGFLYQYDIPDADTAKYLDYHAPLDAQPQVVKDALKKEGLWPDGDTSKIAGGDIFYKMRARGISRGIEDEAEQILRKHDVPGLRFMDEGSRGKKEGVTYNYVTWNQDVLNRTKMLEIDDVPVTRKRSP